MTGAPGTPSFTFVDTTNPISVNGSSASTSVTIPKSLVTRSITLNFTDADDSLAVLGTSVPVTVNTSGGNDTINLGASSSTSTIGTLDNLGASVQVQHGALSTHFGTIQLNVDDQGASGARDYRIGAGSVNVQGHLVTYSTDVGGLAVNLGQGTNTVGVSGNFPNTTTGVFGGAGTNTFNVFDTTHNTLGDLNSFHGLVNLVGGSGANDSVLISDSGTTTGQTYTVHDQQFDRMGTDRVMVRYSGMEGLSLRTGQGVNTVFIAATAPGTPVTVNGGSSADTFLVGNTTDPSSSTLDNILSAVTINGGALDTLSINDGYSQTGRNYTVLSNDVSWRTVGGAPHVHFGGLGAVTVNAGLEGDHFDIQSTPSVTILQLNGGFGDDSFKLAPTAGGANLRIDGQADVDTMDYSGFAINLTVNLVTHTGNNVGTGYLRGIENVYGGSGNDTLTGDANDNLLYGSAGNDTISGGGGSDMLLGGSGDDVLVGGHGQSLLIGGMGSDTLIAGDQGDILIGCYCTYVDEYSNTVDVVALDHIMNEWRSPNTTHDRYECLTGARTDGFNAGYYLNASTLMHDHATDVDNITCGAGVDFFITSGAGVDQVHNVDPSQDPFLSAP
jgi:Ca2+-binding RTX toxin-like protein